MKLYIAIFTIVIHVMWTSAEKEPEAEASGELQDFEYESRMDARPRTSDCKDLCGKCIKINKECPPHKHLETSSGGPYCKSVKRRCCHPPVQESSEMSKRINSILGKDSTVDCHVGHCDCDFRFLQGCYIVSEAKQGCACECTNYNGSKCKGTQVNCIDRDSHFCKNPDRSLESCLQAHNSNCGGY